MSVNVISSRPVELPDASRSIAARNMPAQEFERMRSAEFSEISYSHEGLEIRGYMAVPADSGPKPAIVFNRGGTRRGELTPSSVAQYLGLFASWGYVAIASQYRGAGGSDGRDEWGEGDVRDSLALLEILRVMPDVDMDRLGLVGGSRGGMVALLMLRESSEFRAAVTFGAPTNFTNLPPAGRLHRLLQSYLDSADDYYTAARRRSAALWADELCKQTPLLVQHGTGDRKIDPSHAYDLGLALQRCLHPYKLVVYDNADHILAGRRRESNRDMRTWLDMYVRDKSPLPRTGPHGN